MLGRSTKISIAVVTLISVGVIIVGFIWKGALDRQGEDIVRATASKSALKQEISTADSASRKASPPAKLPDLDREIRVTAALSPGDAERAVAAIETIIRTLKEESNRYNYWIELGSYRKLIGDYQGAEEVWQYAAATWPTESIPYNNLADLYITYLKDYKKGEQNLLLAIEKAPPLFNYYYNAYQFYRYVLKDLAKARAIIEQGLGVNPNDASSYQQILADLNKE